MDNNMLSITEKYLGELCDFSARKAIGIILKRLDLITDKEVLKNVIKEHVFEEFRSLKYNIQAYNRGKEITFFKPTKAEL